MLCCAVQSGAGSGPGHGAGSEERAELLAVAAGPAGKGLPASGEGPAGQGVVPAWHKGPLCFLPQRARGLAAWTAVGPAPPQLSGSGSMEEAGCLGPRDEGLRGTWHLPWDPFHVLCGPGCCSSYQMGAGLTVPRNQLRSWPLGGTFGGGWEVVERCR